MSTRIIDRQVVLDGATEEISIKNCWRLLHRVELAEALRDRQVAAVIILKPSKVTLSSTACLCGVGKEIEDSLRASGIVERYGDDLLTLGVKKVGVLFRERGEEGAWCAWVKNVEGDFRSKFARSTVVYNIYLERLRMMTVLIFVQTEPMGA